MENNIYQRDDKNYMDSDQFNVKLTFFEAIGAIFGSTVLMGLVVLLQNF